jgi:PKD repeat protein
MVFKQRVAVALRPGLVAAAAWLLLTAPPAVSFPLITVSPPAPLTNEQVTFASTVTGVSDQSWDLDGDGRCDDHAGPLAQRSFPIAGTYTVRLCISNGIDEAVQAAHVVIVRNRPPAAAFTYSPFDPLSGDSVTLASTSADPDGPLVSQEWDLDGDGAFDDAQGPIASVSFASGGEHLVGLRVTDREGAASAAAVAIAVRERPPAPISPFPVVRIAGSFSRFGIRIEQLLVTAPDGARVEIRCRGRGCPFRRLIREAKQTVRVRRFARRILRPGAVVQVWVTRAGEIGKYTRFRIRRGKRPTRVDRCLMPGAKRPTRCPS